jgi:hypothetical protein
MALTKVRGSGIDADGQEIIIDADGDSSITADTDDTINFKAGGSDRLTINSSGDIDVEAGDIFFSTAGKGINLGVTSNTDSNTLDDYEEGSFTPTVVSSSFTPSYNHQFGFYTKTGNKVTFEIYLAISSASGTTTNACTFGGLPFTSYNGSTASRYAAPVTVGSWYNGVVAQQGVPHMYVSPNDTGIICVYWNGSTGVQMVGGDVDGNTFLYFGGFYAVA